MIINHDFTQYPLPSNKNYKHLTSMPGWICDITCDLKACNFYVNSTNCTGQYIDLDSNGRY